MKATLIEQQIAENSFQFIRGYTTLTKRLIVDSPTRDGKQIVITVANGSYCDDEVFAFCGDIGTDYETLGEVDIPDWIVEKAENYIDAKETLQSYAERIVEVMESEVVLR